MPKTKHVTQAQTIENNRVALENAESQPVIASKMAEMGYNNTKIAEGKKLLEETRAAFDFNKNEDQEIKQVKAKFDALKDSIQKEYKLNRDKSKIIFRTDQLTLTKLSLDRALPNAYIDWLEVVRTFYKTVEIDNELQTKLATLKITPESISQALANIAAMETARAIYLKVKGESQDATHIKDNAFKKLENWMRDFNAVAKIALKDNPQLLEALGIKVRG